MYNDYNRLPSLDLTEDSSSDHLGDKDGLPLDSGGVGPDELLPAPCDSTELSQQQDWNSYPEGLFAIGEGKEEEEEEEEEGEGGDLKTEEDKVSVVIQSFIQNWGPPWEFQPGSSSLGIPAWEFQPGSSSLGVPAWEFQPGSSSLGVPAWEFQPGSSSLGVPAWEFQLEFPWEFQSGSSSWSFPSPESYMT